MVANGSGREAIVSLQRALLLLVATALFAGIVPAGVVIDRRLKREVEARARDDMAQAPRLLADRNEVQVEAMVMHAKDVARAAGLAEAMRRGDRAAAVRAAEGARAGFGERAVVVSSNGQVWSGPAAGSSLLDAVRRGETPTKLVFDSGALHLVTLVGITRNNAWLGAAGISVQLGGPAAGILAALTRSDVLLLGMNGELVASTASDSVTALIQAQVRAAPRDSRVRLIAAGTRQYLIDAVAERDVATTVFVRDLTRDLEVLPAFRKVIVLSGVAAVLLGMLLGTVVARRIAHPVSALADAADRLAVGEFEAPLMHSSIREIGRLSDAFGAMRTALALRISDVTGANRRLTDRQARLETSQSEILQRERLAVSTRLVAELSHEIRNPIANLRNCLEVIRRRVSDDPQAREFTDLAIDELLRMHELAEQLLDLNRPRDPAVRVADVATVIHEVVVMASAGFAPHERLLHIDLAEAPVASAAITPDALKQVLINLVQNARDALSEHVRTGDGPPRITIGARSAAGRVLIEVSDNGPGIPDNILLRVFDPFFTTKGAVHGVGLGLFVAEGLVRTAGGRITVGNLPNGGVSFCVELPAVSASTNVLPLAET